MSAKRLAIAAIAQNYVIGHNNQLPWHLPNDLKHFKSLTQGHAILMGRNTYESIGKPLPNRINYVLTRQPGYKAPGCVVIANIEEAESDLTPEDKLFIIGGAKIYTQFLPTVETLFLTQVQAEIAGDSFFPQLDMTQWQETAREDHEPDAHHAYAYSFLTLKRK